MSYNPAIPAIDDLVLIFPPVHDPSMPQLAMPTLQRYVHDHCKGIKSRFVDMNLAFFRHSVFKADGLAELASLRRQLTDAQNATEGAGVALKHAELVRALCGQWEQEHEGYKLSFRNLSIPADRRDVVDLMRWLSGPTAFDALALEIASQCIGSRLIGINLTVEDQIGPSLALARTIRTVWPEGTLVWGGALLSRVHEQFGKGFDELWDYLVVREGEVPLAELCRQIILDGVACTDERVLRHNRIRGTAHLGVASPDRSLVLEPFFTSSSTSPDVLTGGEWGDVHIDGYLALETMLPLLISRRCYWGRCKFCTIFESWDPTHRSRSLSSVVAELEELHDSLGVRLFKIVDEAAEPGMLASLSDYIIDAELDIGFEAYAIAEVRFRDAQFVARLGRAGCRQLYFGLESADKAALRVMGKTINQVDHYDEVFSGCSAAGILVHCFMLFGYPGVSEDADRASVEFVVSCESIQCAIIASFVPVVGSGLSAETSGSWSHGGGLTEDIDVLEGFDPDAANARAVMALDEIFGQRPDLALNALLNDESRFVLSNCFGPMFARGWAEDESGQAQSMTLAASRQAIHERVFRDIGDS